MHVCVVSSHGSVPTDLAPVCFEQRSRAQDTAWQQPTVALSPPLALKTRTLRLFALHPLFQAESTTPAGAVAMAVPPGTFEHKPHFGAEVPKQQCCDLWHALGMP